ncbi:MAG: magnesium/cobalt transporter CorA [Candidatus Woesearchaeota archaeon]
MIEVFYYDKSLKTGSLKDISNLRNIKVWVDITNITKEDAAAIKDMFELHSLTVEDMINSNTRIKVEEFPNYLFMVIYGIEKKGKNIGLVEIDLTIGDNFIISNHKANISSIELLKKNKDKIENLFKKGNDFILHKIIDDEIDNYFPILETIDNEIENIEEKVSAKPDQKILKDILSLKRQIITIKKAALPQREKISFLAKNDYRYISKKSVPYFRDIYDHAIRVADAIDNYREAAGNTFDVYMSSVSNSMNEVMKVLSIFATIALPLSVISGIYGTNFTTLPGANFAYGFWGMIIGMLIVCIGMLYFFRKRRWF